MTSISTKLIAAGLIALSGATSAFAVPRTSVLPKAHQAQTRDDQTLALYGPLETPAAPGAEWSRLQVPTAQGLQWIDIESRARKD